MGNASGGAPIKVPELYSIYQFDPVKELESCKLQSPSVLLLVSQY